MAPVMSIELMQLRQAVDFYMKMTDDYEKALREADQELDQQAREIDRLNAVIARYESQ